MKINRRTVAKLLGGFSANAAFQISGANRAFAQNFDEFFDDLGRPLISPPMLEALVSPDFSLQILDAAKAAFGVAGSLVERPNSLRIESGARSLEIFINSGAVHYQDTGKLYEPEYISEPQDPEVPTEFAIALLEKLAFDMSEVELELVTEERTSEAPEVINHHRVDFRQDVSVTAPDGSTTTVPLLGDHTIRVSVGRDGEIIGAFLHRPFLQPLQPTELITRDAAIERGRFILDDPTVDSLVLNSMQQPRLAYWMETFDRPTGRVFPVYLYPPVSGYSHGVFAIPATAEVPVVSIRPREVAGRVLFDALTDGGSAPFTYEWTATTQQGLGDGVLSREPVLDTEFLSGSRYLKVAVVDANKFRVPTQISISIDHPIDEALRQPEAIDWYNAEQTRSIALPPGGPTFAEPPVDLPPGLDWPNMTISDDPIIYGEETEKLAWSIVDPNNLALNGNINAAGWSAIAKITADDGLELSRIAYKNVRMAHKFSVPFYYMSTNAMLNQRGQLKHPPGQNTNGNLLSTLMSPGLRIAVAGGGQAAIARYCVDRIPAGPNSGQMIVEQRFEFHAPVNNMTAWPFNASPQAPFFPLVSYRYIPKAGNQCRIVQPSYRLDFDIRTHKDLCAVTRESDFGPTPFSAIVNPVTTEQRFNAVGANAFGGPGAMDNYHQAPDYTGDANVAQLRAQALKAGGPLAVLVNGMIAAGLFTGPNYPLPILVPQGSFFAQDCVHIHWRWSNVLRLLWRGPPVPGPVGPVFPGPAPHPSQKAGAPMAPGQLVDVFPLVSRINIAERDPLVIENIVNGEPIAPEDIVFWYRATSFNKPADTFFQHGGFFV